MTEFTTLLDLWELEELQINPCYYHPGELT